MYCCQRPGGVDFRAGELIKLRTNEIFVETRISHDRVVLFLKKYTIFIIEACNKAYTVDIEAVCVLTR